MSNTFIIYYFGNIICVKTGRIIDSKDENLKT